MNRDFNNRKITMRIVLIIVIVVVFMFTPMLSWLGNSLGIVTTPVQTGITTVQNAIKGTASFWSRVKNVDSENRKLKQEVAVLKKKVTDYDRIIKENENYKKTLEIRERYDGAESVAAVVVGRTTDNWFGLLSVNKGSSSAIGEEFPVYSYEGLVGKTVKVGTNWSKIQTIIDSEHSVSGIVARTGDLVQIDGDIKLMKNGLCRMSVISENTDVIIGDLIETSGIGGVYPKGLVIGTVMEFKTNEEGSGNYALIKPAVDLEHLNQVLILKKTDKDFDFSEEDK